MFINTEIYALPTEAFSTQFADSMVHTSFEHPLIEKVIQLDKLSPLSIKERKLLNYHLGYIVKATLGH